MAATLRNRRPHRYDATVELECAYSSARKAELDRGALVDTRWRTVMISTALRADPKEVTTSSCGFCAPGAITTVDRAVPIAHEDPTRALGTTNPAPGAQGPWSRALSLLSAAALVLMPKCPFCLVGWLGALGLGGFASHAGVIPLTVLFFFCASQAVFFVSARRTGDVRALISAALGVSLIVGSRFLGDSLGIRWVGIALLATASVFNAVATSRAGRTAA